MVVNLPNTLVNGAVSFWYADAGLPVRRAPLPGPAEADVCIVGAGLTGLWAAYYLKKADPALRVVLLEREFAGYGASGRNGGWLSSSIAGSPARIAARAGRPALAALQRAMIQSVDQVSSVTAEEGINAELVRGGMLVVATTPAQQQRLAGELAALQGGGNPDVTALSAQQTGSRIRIRNALGALFDPHCARVHPAKLVTGLAATVAGLGVRIYESTPVTSIEPGQAHTPHGTVRARYILRATEGYTAELPGLRRRWLPMNSSMVVTEPLPAEMWAELGWAGREVLGNEAHVYLYAQRTADDRIAIGGRGVPYRFASRTPGAGHTAARTIRSLRGLLTEYWPATERLRIEHAWSGVLAVPRDWCAGVELDRGSGLGWAGGYTGNGVTTSNLAGRTLRDLVLDRDTELRRLPWVGWRSRRWEPEPLRWLGVRGLYTAYRVADRRETRTGRPDTSRIATLANRLSGR